METEASLSVPTQTPHQTPDTYPGLFWGYLVVWGLLTLYLIVLGIKCSRLEKKVGVQSASAQTAE